MLGDHDWNEVECLLDEVRIRAIREDVLPMTLVAVFHSGEPAALLELPPFTIEDADAITDELCRFLPTIYPHQLVFTRPAIHDDLDPRGRLHAMQVLLWERDLPPRYRLVPVPIRGGVDGPPFAVEGPDPWMRRLVEALDRQPPWPVHIDTRLPEGFDLVVLRGSPLARLLASLHQDV